MGLRSQRGDVVDDVVLVGIDVFAVFPLLFFAEYDRNRQESAIFFEQSLYFRGLEKFLFSSSMNNTISVPRSALSIFSIVYSGDPSQLHMTACAPSR